MYPYAEKVLQGLLSVFSLFVFCCIISICAIRVKKKIEKKLAPKKPDTKNLRRIRNRKPKTIKSIEINPDEVDRIYVRKSS